MDSKVEMHDDGFQCPECGCGSAHQVRVEDTFEYGAGKDHVLLKAWVKLDVCDKCKTHFNTEDSERSRHDAICQHLDLLTPREILQIRVSMQLSRARFAELTGVGNASLARWESGQLIQSRSHDNLIRLAQSASNIKFLECRARRELKSINELENFPDRAEPRSLDGQKLNNAISAASVFSLRKAG